MRYLDPKYDLAFKKDDFCERIDLQRSEYYLKGISFLISQISSLLQIDQWLNLS